MKRNNIKKLFLKLSVCCLTLVFVIAVIWITEPETYGSSKIDGKQFALEMANLINNMNENEENKNVVGEISGITITELESTALRYKLEGSANPYEDALNHIKELKSEELVAEQNRITVTMDEAIEYTQ